MAEKRTKADRLQRSIDRTERRTGARSEEAVTKQEQEQEPVTTIPNPIQLEEELSKRKSAA